MYRLSFDSRITTSKPTSESESTQALSYWRFSASLEDHPDEKVARAVIFLHKTPPTLYTIHVDSRYRGFRIGTKLLDYVLDTVDGDDSIGALDAKLNMNWIDAEGKPSTAWIAKWLMDKGFIPQITVSYANDTGYMTMRRFSSAVS